MSLARQLGIGDRELVALVGGGGKSTVLLGLGRELAATGNRVILTTTTKLGREQADSAGTVCWSADTECAVAALEQAGPVMLVTDGDDHKVTGPPPEVVDRVFATSGADYVIVEADGSRGRPLKAPASHEPVVPETTSLVVVLIGVDAIGRPLAEVAHRVQEAQRFTGLDRAHIVSAVDCAEVLLHPEGVLRTAPVGARAVVAVTKAASQEELDAATDICDEVRSRRPEIDAVILSPIA